MDGVTRRPSATHSSGAAQTQGPTRAYRRHAGVLSAMNPWRSTDDSDRPQFASTCIGRTPPDVRPDADKSVAVRTDQGLSTAPAKSGPLAVPARAAAEPANRMTHSDAVGGPASDRSAVTLDRCAATRGPPCKKVLIWEVELGKVTRSKAPRLKVQSQGGREGKKPAEGLV